MVSSPKPPNPYTTASAQQGAEAGAAQQSSIINNPNEYSNYGSQIYSIAGWEPTQDASGKTIYTPRYNKTTTLSPDEQKIANYDTGTRYNVGQTALGVSSRMPAYFAGGINTSGWQPWQAAAGPGAVRQDQGATDRAGIENAIMASYARNTAPQQQAEQVSMANRGLAPGSQGYGTMQQGQLDANAEASRQAYLASGQESRQAQGAYNDATRLKYEMGADWANQLNQLRQAQSQEGFALRNQPLNEIAALMSGAQVNMPQFSAMSRQGINAAPIGQYIADNYANQVASANATNQGLFSLAGAGLGAAGMGMGKGGMWGKA